MEKYDRYPSIQTLERSDVRPANVKNLSVDSGVNPITHDVRVNYTEWRRIIIEIDSRLEKILPVDGVTWLLASLCSHTDQSTLIFLYLTITDDTLFYLR